MNIRINNFGPINECDFEIKDINLLIGQQASGKSTICKLVFYFLNMKNEFFSYILEKFEENDSHLSKYYLTREFHKQIRKRFIEFFGPTSHNKNIYIKFNYTPETWVEVKLDKEEHKYINLVFSHSIIDCIYNIIKNKKSDYNSLQKQITLFDSSNVISSDKKRRSIISEINHDLSNLFNFDQEILFIPAGRSLLSTISDQLQNIHPFLLDYPMRSFIEKINITRSYFTKRIEDIIKEKQVLEQTEIWFSAVRKAHNYVKNILKGEYRFDNEGGKIFIKKNVFTKITLCSSGQQESLWILLSLFLIVLDKVKVFVFIEEPEAHLFPLAQKEIIDFICFINNSLKCSFFITTHSPYILSSINNNIYVNNVSHKKDKKDKLTKIIPEQQWIKYDNVCGYLIEEGKFINLLDNELKQIKSELIDDCSFAINNTYDNIFKIENE